MARFGRSFPVPFHRIIRYPLGRATIAVSGTITTATESNIVSGGRTIILTLTGDTWVPSGAAFNAQRQNLINGLDSSGVEATGWDAVVKATQGVAGVVRTSDTVATITLDSFVTYDITIDETITPTIPTTALVTGLSAIVGVPTFTISQAGSSSGSGIFRSGILSGMKRAA